MRKSTHESLTDDLQAAKDLGLFIIWEKARHRKDEILQDLENKFAIIQRYEINWTKGLVFENFQRFYADLDLRGVYHALRKGAGPFLLVTVVDPDPVIEPCKTTRGWRLANANFIEAKEKYRSWTGSFQVHSTETAWETNRDLSLLLGMGAKQYVESIRPTSCHDIKIIGRDLTGAHGWKSLSELFWVLNRSVNYIVISDELERSEVLPTSCRAVNLLTDDYWAIHALTNTRQHPPSAPCGGRFKVRVGDANMFIGIRFVGDQFFDPNWANDLLESRVLDRKGYYRPSEENRAWALAYQEVCHKHIPRLQDRHRLVEMAKMRGIKDWQENLPLNASLGIYLIQRYLDLRGYSFVKPNDRAIFYRAPNGRMPGRMKSRLMALLRRFWGLIRQEVYQPFSKQYWRARDRILFEVPIARNVMLYLRGYHSN